MVYQPFTNTYSNSVIIVTRQGHSYEERAVHVQQGAKSWWINPRVQIQLLMPNGTPLSRGACILSFMEGLVAAGQIVILRERRTNKHQGDFAFHRASWISYEYFLFGLAWGKAQWEPLRAQLEKTIVPAQRLAVLTATGQYYFTHRFEQSLALRVPIS